MSLDATVVLTDGQSGIEVEVDRGLATSQGPEDVLPPVRGGAVPPDQNPALHYIASLVSTESRKVQASALRVVARLFGFGLDTMPWAGLGPVHTRALRALLARRYAPGTANRYLASVREVLRGARRLGQITHDELEVALDFKPVPGSRVPPGRELMTGEIRRLFDAAKRDPRRRRGARDAAIVAMLFGGGMRRSEVVRADREGYNGQSVTVIGKGNKERVVPLPAGARRAIDAWLVVRGDHPGPLVESLLGGGRIRPDMINHALWRLIRRSGVSDATTHDGRRTFITYLLEEAGVPITVVQDLVGHASVEQTAKYRRGRVQARELAVELLVVPF
jgi:integrase